MYLAGREIQYAIDCGRLIVRPRPEEMDSGYDETSIDLHLDHVREAKIWDVPKLRESEAARGSSNLEVNIARVDWKKLSARYLTTPPADPGPADNVFLRGTQVIVRPGGFLLWQTREWVETPKQNPSLICFVEGKSTRARTGIIVHLTAPIIHSGWGGQITLEIANLGPFHFVLHENDVIAQLAVAMISSPPDVTLKRTRSATEGQTDVGGRPAETPQRRGRPRN